MEKKVYTYLVEIKCKAPQGYKPRRMTYKGIGFAKTQRAHAKVELIAIASIKASLEEKNKGVDIDITAKATLYLTDIIFDTDDN